MLLFWVIRAATSYLGQGGCFPSGISAGKKRASGAVRTSQLLWTWLVMRFSRGGLKKEWTNIPSQWAKDQNPRRNGPEQTVHRQLRKWHFLYLKSYSVSLIIIAMPILQNTTAQTSMCSHTVSCQGWREASTPLCCDNKCAICQELSKKNVFNIFIGV